MTGREGRGFPEDFDHCLWSFIRSLKGAACAPKSCELFLILLSCPHLLPVPKISCNQSTFELTYFCSLMGKFFLQLRGGPIGLNITAWAASIVMKCYDNIWMAILRSNKIDLLAYLRYVDDSRSFIKGLRKGVRWCGGEFKYDIE